MDETELHAKPEIITCEQGSDEWHNLRIGIPTASNFSTIMAKGKGKDPSKTRRKYMLQLIGERITGERAESYSNPHMERGNEMEALAREAYQNATFNDVQQVGFIRTGPVGYSPDGLVCDNGLVEIKTKLPHLQIEVLLTGKVPPEHLHQCQGGLWVSQREWIDFVSYWPGLPIFIKRLHRDELFIAEIKAAVDEFLQEMDDLQKTIEAMF